MEVLLGQFKKSLIASGLMAPEEIETFVDLLPSDGKPKDGAELARLLVRHKKLTKFQAQAIFQGKTKGLIMGDYVVLDRIGAGGMGQVYKARHKVMDRVVALKTLPPAATRLETAVKRFHREVKVAARLSHPNIVTAFDAGEAHGTHYLVMELVEGNDLASRVRQGGRLPVPTALDYTLQAAKGLEYAHKQKVIHRDIKPSNLLLDKEGTVKVLDMGLARLNDTVGRDDPAGQHTLTGTGQAMGTIDFMPPEQAENVKTADERSDIYSLGCTLYYLLTGRAVYDGDTTIMRLLAHRDADIPSLRAERPDVPEHLDAVFQKMVAKKPEDRYASITAVIAELETCASPKPEYMAETSDLGNAPLALANAETQTRPKSEETPADESLMLGLPVVSPVETIRRRLLGKNKKQQIILASAAACLCFVLLAAGIAIVSRSRDGEEVAQNEEKASIELTQQLSTPHLEPKSEQGGNGEASSISEVCAADLPPTTDSKPAENWALKFDGETSGVSIPKLRYDGTYPITMEAVVNPQHVDSSCIITTTGCLLEISSSAKQWEMRMSMLEPESHYFVWGQTKPAEDVPVHLAGVFDGKTMRLYVDGKEQSPGKVHVGVVGVSSLRRLEPDEAVRGSLKSYGTGFTIGRLFDGAKEANHFHGIIDEVRISNTARYTEDFTPQGRFEPDKYTMALYHFDEGSGDVLHDASGNGYDGTIVGAKWVKGDERSRTHEKIASAANMKAPDTPSNGWTFTEPVNLGSLVNSSDKEGRPALSPDALTLFFSSLRHGGLGQSDLWMSTRQSMSEPFREPVNLGPVVNSEAADGHPALTSDGLTLFFSSLRPGGNGKNDLWMATRRSLEDPFEEPVNLGPTVNTRYHECSSAISADGLTLLFRSDRPNGSNDPSNLDIWSCTRKSTTEPFNSPVNLGPTINTPYRECFPVLSPDSLTLIFSSDRPGTLGKDDLWMSTRTSTSEPFGEPVHLGPPINTSSDDNGPVFSPDGNTLLFMSDRPEGYGWTDLWMTHINRPGKTTTTPPESSPPLAIAPFTPEQAKQHQKAWADHLGIPVEFENSIGMKMVLIPPGEFMMGAPDSDPDAENDEKPQHPAKIAKPYYAAAHEVTVGQFRAFVAETEYKADAGRAAEDNNWENPGFQQSDEHPVTFVSWNDAAAFCEWLGNKEDQEYGLPSEAQWEYACRSGSATRWCFGDDVKELEQYAWYDEIEGHEPKSVGRNLPNGFQMFDMCGNVWEWCSDSYAIDYSNVSPTDSPSGSSGTLKRVLRGGGFCTQFQSVRSASRSGFEPSFRDITVGFRPVLLIDLDNRP